MFSKCIFENVLFENCRFYKSDNINIFSDECIFMKSIFKNCNLESSVFKEFRINVLIVNNQIIDCYCRGLKIINSAI